MTFASTQKAGQSYGHRQKSWLASLHHYCFGNKERKFSFVLRFATIVSQKHSGNIIY